MFLAVAALFTLSVVVFTLQIVCLVSTHWIRQETYEYTQNAGIFEFWMKPNGTDTSYDLHKYRCADIQDVECNVITDLMACGVVSLILGFLHMALCSRFLFDKSQGSTIVSQAGYFAGFVGAMQGIIAVMLLGIFSYFRKIYFVDLDDDSTKNDVTYQFAWKLMIAVTILIFLNNCGLNCALAHGYGFSKPSTPTAPESQTPDPSFKSQTDKSSLNKQIEDEEKAGQHEPLIG